MAYITNPYAPKARRLAINILRREHLSFSEVARIVGVHRSTIYRWNQKDSKHSGEHIPTLASRPHRHPNQLPQETVQQVIALRKKLQRCTPIIHAHMRQLGYQISLSSIERILRRERLTHKKKQAKYPRTIKRPPVERPGDLVQIDTLHYVKADGSRFYVYAAIDVFSRGAFAAYAPAISAEKSFAVLLEAQVFFNFAIHMVQADNGPELSPGFARLLKASGIILRHSRVLKPNDNAHVERFIRTLQEECFDRKLPDVRRIEKDLTDYLHYYNHSRLHLGLNIETPANAVAKVLK